MIQAAEQELLTIPLSLACGAWKGRTMQESSSHTAGSTELTSDSQQLQLQAGPTFTEECHIRHVNVSRYITKMK